VRACACACAFLCMRAQRVAWRPAWRVTPARCCLWTLAPPLGVHWACMHASAGADAHLGLRAALIAHHHAIDNGELVPEAGEADLGDG